MAINYYIEIGGGGGGSTSLTVGTFDGSAAVAAGLTISSNVLYAQSADATHPGMINTGSQTMTGAKTFSTSVLSPIFSTNAANPASAGVVRLANLEYIKWRNFANGADIGIQLDASNIFQFGGAITSSAGIIATTGAFSGAVSGTTGTFTGAVSGTTGTFSSTLAATALTLTAASAINGSADAVQLTIKANGTQTANLQNWTDNTPTVVASVSAAGNFVVAGTGSGAAPAFQCGTGSTKGGLYSNGGSGCVFAFNGTDVITYKGTEIDFAAQVFFRSGGGVSAPAIAFGTENQTGFYRIGTNNLGMTVAGTKLLDMSAAAFAISGVTTIGTGTAGQHVLNTLVKTNGASAGTITNAPTAGNPVGFIQITVNGTTSYVPYWQ